MLQYLTNDKSEASYAKLRSVTGQSALDEFLNTAELAGTDFTAEKPNRQTRVIDPTQRDPYLPTDCEQRATVQRQAAHRNRLTVPRRPPWDSKTSPAQLDSRERESLLQWRRELADLVENHDLLMTPFERNLEVWRQLWRVVERSDLLVQIVDARDPLLFRSEDLERYVKEVGAGKKNLLLVNKADLLTSGQREAWANYFDSQGINFEFFSARTDNNDVASASDSDDESGTDLKDPGKLPSSKTRTLAVDEPSLEARARTRDSSSPEGRSRSCILDVDELEALFMANVQSMTEPKSTDEASEAAPEDSTDDAPADGAPLRKATIGLVGYPNVGKSSTINALLGAKKVSVSATPGKTKHFQTLHLSPSLVLCDCPGLVLPNFAATAAELICAGVLPVDQQREFRGPTALVARRIPRSALEAAYGIRIPVRPVEEGGSEVPTASELLSAYARARGFAASGGAGQPDESRAARYVLKDYVRGRLPWCHPPPVEPPMDEVDFNAELYGNGQGLQQFRLNRKNAQEGPIMSRKSQQVDKTFFAPPAVPEGHVSSPFGYVDQGRGGKELSGRKQRLMVALERGVDPSEVQMGSGKKHFKGRRGRGGGKAHAYDDG